jgi:hypothetical protein
MDNCRRCWEYIFIYSLNCVYGAYRKHLQISYKYPPSTQPHYSTTTYHFGYADLSNSVTYLIETI